MSREVSPITGTFPDSKKIMCKDCLYRDRDSITIGDETIECGISKAYCDIFPEGGDGKPLDVLFQNAICPEYVKDGV